MHDGRTRPPKGTKDAGKGIKGSSKRHQENPNGQRVFRTDVIKGGQNFQNEERP